jgi:hypothetical protein
LDAGPSLDLSIRIATGKMTGAMIAGSLQFVGDPRITIKRLESLKTPKRSQMLYTSETLAHLSKSTSPKPVGQIKSAGGNEVPVFEFAP